MRRPLDPLPTETVERADRKFRQIAAAIVEERKVGITPDESGELVAAGSLAVTGLGRHVPRRDGHQAVELGSASGCDHDRLFDFYDMGSDQIRRGNSFFCRIIHHQRTPAQEISC